LAFDEMDIEQPMVSLAVRPDGRRNWVLRKSAAAEPAHEQAQMPAPSSAPIPPRRRLGGSGAGDSAAAPYAPASAPRSSALRQYFRRTYYIAVRPARPSSGTMSGPQRPAPGRWIWPAARSN